MQARSIYANCRLTVDQRGWMMDLPDKRVAPFDFLWPAPRKRPAYRWVERPLWDSDPLQPGWVLSPLPGAKFRTYKPLEEETGLFLTFAATEPTPEGCLSCASKYGPLGVLAAYPVLSLDESEQAHQALYPSHLAREWEWPDRLELFDLWRDNIIWMDHLVKLWRMAEEGDNSGLAQFITWRGDTFVHQLPDRPVSDFPQAFPDWRQRGKVLWTDPYYVLHGERLFNQGDLVGPALKRVQEI